MSQLRYRNDIPRDERYSAGVAPDVLSPGECAIGKSAPGGTVYLAFCFTRVTDGKPETRRIPIHVGGTPDNDGWGFTLVVPGVWQVTPSIKCSERLHNDPSDSAKYEDVEVWHETPQVVGVPDDEPWM